MNTYNSFDIDKIIIFEMFQNISFQTFANEIRALKSISGNNVLRPVRNLEINIE